jgi:hypothetical protein
VSELSAQLEAERTQNSGQVSELSAQLEAERTQNREQVSELSAQLEAERTQNREQTAHIEYHLQRISSYEASVRELQRALEQNRGESNQLAVRLETERTQNAETVRSLTKEKRAVGSELEQAGRTLRTSREENVRLFHTLEIQAANNTGLRAYQGRLEQRMANVSRELRNAGEALAQKDVKLPSVFDSIAEDIERIRTPSKLWRVVKALGGLRFAPPGAPRTAAERRAIAAELKLGLRDIRKALSSETSAPEDAALHLTRLFELRQRTRQVADSVKPWAAIRSTTPAWNFIHWARHALSTFSEKRRAAVLFDSAWYLGKYPDVATSNADPIDHYFTWGVHEGRNPNAVFDTNWYLSRNPDVASSGMNPLEHYCESGAREGRDPSALFSTTWYLSENPDVAAAGINPLQHYLQSGVAERRNPHPIFDCAYYLKQNPAATDVNPIEHYLGSKGAECGSPHPIFDASWYLEQYADVAASGANPLLQYLDTGGRQGRDPHPLFDSSWYLDSHPDIRQSDLNPLVHYIIAGSKEGRDPHPLFDSSWYRAKYSEELATAGTEPLAHYLQIGAGEGKDPHPLFDTSWYLEANPDVAKHGINPLVHYNIAGGLEGRDPHPLFDSSWYRETNPDVAQPGINPLRHYLLTGAREGRDPHPLFQSKYYEEQRQAHRFLPSELSPSSKRSEAKPAQRSARAKEVVYAFTSICLNYIPKAIVLARTLKKHNPEVHFCVLINDPVPEGALKDVDAFDEVVTIEDLNIPDKPSWIFRHTVVELCTAVKGFFLVDLLERPDCKAAFYFDPDIVCFAGLNVLTDKLKEASILLTPHLTDPEATTEAILDNEICALKHGVYNLGFLGVRPSAEGRRFARWWRDRLRDFCRADIPGGLFTDQRWVDLAPALFQELHIVRHPGCNAATWNLTNRKIEGDFARGFTVNGESLIFYHFSGFDSGAQGAMLDKYGAEMPAAQLLREWYIQETVKSGDAYFAQFPWTLAFFSNGEPIAEKQRTLYRDRIDLQQAFSNPFDTSTPGKSYYHWYQSEVLGRPIQHDGFGYNPLVEFVEAKAPLPPNPFFDCAWYLQQNQDVFAERANPLIHFVLSGANEGRRPSAGFFPLYYREQLPPAERSQNPLAHYLCRGLSENRRIDPRYDSRADAAARDRLCAWAKSGPPLILLVSHYGGGGTEKHLRDLVERAGERAKFIQLTPGRDGFVRLFAREDELGIKVVFDPLEQFDVLVDVLRECEPRRIHVHHILGNEEYLAALVHALKLPFDFTIHDYYVLAPSPHLIGPNARFLGDDLEAHEDELLAASIAPRRPSSLAQWQKAHAWLVTDAERVIAPSRDVARRFSRFFPGLKPIVAGHPETGKTARETNFSSIAASNGLRIALLGDFLRHKGKETILECARIARSEEIKLSFELIGDAHADSRLLADAGIRVSGRYEEQDVQSLLKDRQPHLIWYPALCPETYSYTLSIGLKSGLPLVVTDLGSLPERVAGRAWTWVCPWQFTPSEWIEFFVRIRDSNFIPTAAPPVPAGAPPATSDFYYTDYLTVLAPGQVRTGRKPDGALAVSC